MTPVRDLNYVKDTVRGFLRVAEEPRTIGQVVNIGRGEGITIGDLVDRILKLLGVELPIEQEAERMRPEKSEVLKLICDNTRARQWLDWSPQYTLDAGLTETINFVRETLASFRTSKYAQ